MDHKEVAVTQITSPEAASEADPGRRERKKQRTRDALFEAAMELFAARAQVLIEKWAEDNPAIAEE